MEVVTVSMAVPMVAVSVLAMMPPSVRRVRTGRQTDRIVVPVRITVPSRVISPPIWFTFHAVLVLLIVVLVL